MFTETDVVTVRPARCILTHFKKKYIFLHRLMASSCNDIQLLLSCQINEFNSITGNADREVCILRFLRVLHCVDQFFGSEYVYVQVMCTLLEVSVQNVYQVLGTLFVVVAECARVDGLGVGDSVQSVLIRQFCYRVQGSKKSALLCAVRRVSSWRQRLTGFSSVRQRTSCLPYTTLEVMVRIEVVGSESR